MAPGKDGGKDWIGLWGRAVECFLFRTTKGIPSVYIHTHNYSKKNIYPWRLYSTFSWSLCIYLVYFCFFFFLYIYIFMCCKHFSQLSNQENYIHLSDCCLTKLNWKNALHICVFTNLFFSSFNQVEITSVNLRKVSDTWNLPFSFERNKKNMQTKVTFLGWYIYF